MTVEESVSEYDETKTLPPVSAEGMPVSFRTQLASILIAQGHPSEFVCYSIAEDNGKEAGVARVYCYSCNGMHNVVLPGKDGDEILADLRRARMLSID
jgi:hypothetical protein